jgi:hypothetical protein
MSKRSKQGDQRKSPRCRQGKKKRLNKEQAVLRIKNHYETKQREQEQSGPKSGWYEPTEQKAHVDDL